MSINRIVNQPLLISSIAGALPAGSNLIGNVGLANLGAISPTTGGNSTNTNLAISGVFTGTGEDVSQFSEIRIFAYSSHASATNGMQIQFSVDNATWRTVDTYTIAATTVFQDSVPVGAQYFRLVYTNGATATTTLNIQVMYNRIAGNPSSSRASDAMTNENDTVDVLARLAGFNGTTWDRLRTTGTGILNVVLTAGSAAIGTVGVTTGQTAAGSTATGNALRVGGVAATAQPTARTAGQAVELFVDKVGRPVIADTQIRTLRGSNTITLTTTTETTLVAAGGAGVFNDITHISLCNTNASATTVVLRDATGGTVRKRWTLPGGSVGGPNIRVPWPQTTANNNWTLQQEGTAVSSVIANVDWIIEI